MTGRSEARQSTRESPVVESCPICRTLMLETVDEDGTPTYEPRRLLGVRDAAGRIHHPDDIAFVYADEGDTMSDDERTLGAEQIWIGVHLSGELAITASEFEANRWRDAGWRVDGPWARVDYVREDAHAV